MKRIAGILLGLAVALGGTSAAHADRPFSWTGIYVGAHGAWAWDSVEFPTAKPHPAGPPRQDLNGGGLGVQLGALYQMDWLVVGAEADLTKFNLTGTVRDGNFITQTDTFNWTGTVRGKLGIAMGRLMPYATAGWAWGNATRGQQCPDPAAAGNINTHCNAANGFAPYNLSASRTHDGLVYGGGFLWAFSGNWVARAEALIFDLGEQTYTLGPAANGKTANVSVIEHDMVQFRIGIDGKF